MPNLTLLHFKKIIIIFWTLWWFIALWTDVVGGLAHLGILKASWAPDTNYPFLVQSLQMYHSPRWLPILLFVCILLWSLSSTLAFSWASVSLATNNAYFKGWANNAFVISLSFWLAFFLADQAIMDFKLEENHMVQGGFELLTFLAFHLLPDQIDNA